MPQFLNQRNMNFYKIHASISNLKRYKKLGLEHVEPYKGEERSDTFIYGQTFISCIDAFYIFFDLGIFLIYKILSSITSHNSSLWCSYVCFLWSDCCFYQINSIKLERRDKITQRVQNYMIELGSRLINCTCEEKSAKR